MVNATRKIKWANETKNEFRKGTAKVCRPGIEEDMRKSKSRHGGQVECSRGGIANIKSSIKKMPEVIQGQKKKAVWLKDKQIKRVAYQVRDVGRVSSYRVQ